MKGKTIFLLLAVSLLLTGCSWLDGYYVHVTDHREQSGSIQIEAVSAADYTQLYGVLEEMIASGTESGMINVSEYDQEIVKSSMDIAVRHAEKLYPIGAYAVEKISYEIGDNSGRPTIAVNIDYRRSRTEIQRIRSVPTMEDAQNIVKEALEDCDSGVVMRISAYKETDFSQVVQDYARSYPEQVMETPQVAAAIYGTGNDRVVELTFTYQTSRDSLRSMKLQVQPVFESATLYVSGEGADSQKYAQLYAFLMERYDYTLETSITPAYSLLRHGVGDSRAFATVYAAMCRMAGLECLTVTGTHNGSPRTWNIVLDNGNYFHVDLLRCNEIGGFREFTDGEMSGYVWDYSTYPECPPVFVPSEQETNPQETQAIQTMPAETQEGTAPADVTEGTEALEAAIPGETEALTEPTAVPPENLE